MNRNFLIFGLLLLLPGLCAVDVALSEGPVSWAVSQNYFWGTPISNFVFWIGLAHAGTFFSAILLVLGARFQHRIALLAEFSTLAALVVAGTFPLLHMGIPTLFYELFPMGNARSRLVNVESPLVWDFVAIAAYTTASTVFLFLHLLRSQFPNLEKFRRPMAWILFPLVLWVHTIVSHDFAVTFVPEWQGAYFPLYFICGALYSGIALMQLLLEISKRRVRRVEDLLLVFSWGMLAFWIWETMVKGVWHPENLVLGFLVPQLLWTKKVRENAVGRTLIAISVMAGLWLERILLVQPILLEWTWVDIGLLAFSIGAFCTVFALLRIFCGKFFAKAIAENSSESFEATSDAFAKVPFLLASFVGILAAVKFVVYFIQKNPTFNLLHMIPLTLPIAAVVAILILAIFMVKEAWGEKRSIALTLAAALLGAGAFGWIYRGVDLDYYEDFEKVKDEKPFEVRSEADAKNLWNARCAACHGQDGSFNRKFVREFYPLPQKLSIERLDSIGEDSLINVVLNGRSYMRPFRGRVSESEALALVRYLRKLAEDKQKKQEENER